MKRTVRAILAATVLFVLLGTMLASCTLVDSTATAQALEKIYLEKYENLEKEYKAKIADYMERIEALEAEAEENLTAQAELKAQYDAKVAELEAIGEVHDAAIAELKAEHERNIAALNEESENYKKLISTLQTAYDDKVAELKAAHTASAEALAAQKAEYEKRIAELEAAGGADASELAALQAAYDEKVAELNALQIAHGAAMAELKAEYDAEIARLESEAQTNADTIAALTKAYNDKAAELAAQKLANEQALADLGAQYEARIAELEAEAVANAEAMAALKAGYDSQIQDLESQLAELRAKIKHTVTFVADGANEIYEDIKVSDGASIDEPASPTRTGYTFLGWYVDGEKVSFPYTVSSNTVLTAAYSAVNYTITYNTNGGVMPESYPTTYTVESGCKLVNPTRDGFLFIGWYATPELKGERVSTIRVGETGDRAFYAKWNAASGGVIYTLSSDGSYYSVTGTDGSEVDIVIADVIDGVPVTRIANSAFENKQKIQSITVPDSVTYIGSSAFDNCLSLIELNLGNGITEIPECMAQGCVRLESISIPDSVKRIDSYAFEKCTALEDVTLSENLEWFGAYVFQECDSLECINIPDAVEMINQRLFNGCDNLRTVEISENSKLEWIGPGVFSNCVKLESIYIPKEVTQIDDYNFEGCKNLTEIRVAKENKNYTSVDGVIYGKNMKTLVTYPMGKTSTEFIVPESVEKIGNRAFSQCSNLKTIVLPVGLLSIDNYAFYSCSNLLTINIPDGITVIPNFAFYNCVSLSNISFPDSVTSIGSSAFQSCYNLVAVTLGRNISSIGDYAFSNCSSLYVVYNNTDLLLEFGSDNNGYVARNAKAIVDNGRVSYRDDGKEYILTDDGFLFEYDGEKYRLTAYAGTETTVTLPDSINGNEYEIYHMRGVIDLVIPGTVSKVGYEAFYNCYSLRSVVIPDSMTEIEDNAFADCRNLTTVTIPNSVTMIGNYAFRYCTNLSSVVIGNGVTSILHWSFDNCKKLKDVYYVGTEAEWENIEIGSENSYLTSATRYYYSKTEPMTEGKFWHYVDGEVVVWDTVHSHTYSVTFVAPTATDDGYNLNTCTGCSYSYKDSFVTPTDFAVTQSNRALFGYTGAADEAIDIPAVFEKDGTWYRVTEIADYAFYNGVKIASVTIPETVTSIGGSSFFNCSSLKSITVDEANAVYKSIDGVLYTEDGSVLILYPSAKDLSVFTVPAEVTVIEAYAFRESKLDEVILHDNITEIKANSFTYSTIKSITLYGVSYIGEYTFDNCKNLTSIVIPDTVERIDYSAFGYCSSLTTVVIGSGVDTVDFRAFYGCNNLTTVYYNGSASDWSNIKFGESNECLTKATIYYYSETEPTKAGNYWYYDASGEIAVW